MIYLYKLFSKNRSYVYSRNYHSILPSAKTKMYLPNPNRHRLNIQKPIPVPSVQKSITRKNKLDIEMLPKAIYEQVFLEEHVDNSNKQILDQCKKELLKHGMNSKIDDTQKDIDLKIPPLIGKNIEEHFQNIGESQVKIYRELMFDLLTNIPDAPTSWLMQPGWTRYVPNCEPQTVLYPEESSLVFDVEVCMMAGKAPTLATAVSNKAWYAWICPSLVEGTIKPVTGNQYHVNSLIPIESSADDDGLNLSHHQLKEKVIVGHNISFDRARIKEQYWLKKTGTRFVDTMSLHICVGGLTSYQRTVIKSGKFLEEDDEWKDMSSLNNLVDVYKLYCGKNIEKKN